MQSFDTQHPPRVGKIACFPRFSISYSVFSNTGPLLTLWDHIFWRLLTTSLYFILALYHTSNSIAATRRNSIDRYLNGLINFLTIL